MSVSTEGLEYQSNRIEKVLSLHKIPARVTGGTVTPRWIRFQVLPEVGARMSRLTGLTEEMAAALDVPNCRMSRRGAAVDIEVPRDDPMPVRLLPLYRQLDDEGAGAIPPATAILGIAEDGAPLLIRLPSPDVAHILIAGTTGSGKTVLMQSMILGLAMANQAPGLFSTDGGLALVLIDLKSHPFTCFAPLPHLAREVVTTPHAALEALKSLTRLMDKTGERASSDARVIVFIDELADLLMVGGKEVQDALTRLTQRGRGAGIHVVAATQKPSAEVIGPLVKANFPVRLVGRVTCASDAHTATGWAGTGAERLMGRGDFLAVAEGRVVRFQAAHVSPDEIREVVATLGRGKTPKIETTSVITPPAPVVEVLPPAVVEPDRIEALAARLAPWWEQNKDQWGAKSAAVRFLFGADAPAGGTFWDDTIDAIALCEAKSSTSTSESPPHLG